jgi:predicted aminopeptidase
VGRRQEPVSTSRPPRGLLLALLTLLTAGCATVDYYAQSIAGQQRLLAARRPIPAVVEDAGTSETVRRQLLHAAAAREFAARELGLPDNGSYRSYADVGRRYVAWAVVATPELSLEPRAWCFPIAGCVTYRGYFDEADARRFAGERRAAGDDVHVAGVAAYSTLGWFDDPVLSSVVDWPEAELAGLIFHELAHQRLYVPGDTAFNEAFAVTVEQAGVRRWLARQGPPAALAGYERAQRQRLAFLDLAFATRAELRDLYASDRSPAAMRARKAAILGEFQRRCEGLAARPDGSPRYRAWCGEPSNARIAAVVTYHELVPGLAALLESHGGDLVAFYRAVDTLVARSPAERREALERARSGTPSPDSRGSVAGASAGAG